jgi:hypothetical protein
MRVEFGTPPQTTSLMIDFLIIKAPPTYNVILGRKTLYELGATISIPYLKMKFLTPYGVGEECGDQHMSQNCYVLSLKGRGAQVNQVDAKEHKDPKDLESQSTVEPIDEIEQVKIAEGKTVNIGKAI